MPTRISDIEQKKSFEQIVYRTSLLLGIIINVMLSLIDILSIGLDKSLKLELAGLVFLIIFYIYSFYSSSKWQYPIFIIIFFIIIDLAWIFDGGSNIIHILIYIVISIYAILIIAPIFRRALMVFILSNAIMLVAIEMYGNVLIFYLDHNIEYQTIFRIILLISISSILVVMIYLRRIYDKERLTLLENNSALITLNNEVVKINNDLMVANQELIDINHSVEDIVKGLENKKAQVERLKENLEIRVLSRTEQLIRKNDELDLLFYRSSHDFRRPLTSLLGLTEFAQIACTSEAKDILMLVGKTAKEMDNMFYKFYNLYRINHFKEEYKVYTINEIYKILEERITAKNGELTLANKIKEIDIEDKRNLLLLFVFENLVENALNYVKHSETAKIEIMADEEDNELTFKIKDYGQGIAKEFQAKVFDMYFKANLKSTGNGLGLYVVSKAIDKLGGKVELNSMENEYSEFTIMYPRHISEEDKDDL